MTSDLKQCPDCGRPASADSTTGLCLDCLQKESAGARSGLDQLGPHGTAVVSPPPLEPNPIAGLFPQLDVLECLGQGGMGTVYKARQPKLDRFAALKILMAGKESDPQFAERFTREARALARLNHPNIVTVYDFGEAGGSYYLLMEYIDGANLRQMMAAGQMKPETALQIVPRLCEALQFAHDHGVVHRDIKPANILMDKLGRVKIADFGIAKMAGRQTEGLDLTGDRQMMGTPHYMAPEQVERPSQVDHRADIYSLGVVFYEMLTGELPLGKFAAPSSKPGVDARLDEVVFRALEKEPARRYQHASEIKTELETIAGTTPRLVAAAPANPPPGAPGVGVPPLLASINAAKLKRMVLLPAVGLLLAVALRVVSVVKLLQLAEPAAKAAVKMADPESGTAQVIHAVGKAAVGYEVFSVLLAPFIFYGAIRMMQMRSYVWSVVAAILAIASMGVFTSLVGLWALLVLLRSKVRDAFVAAPHG